MFISIFFYNFICRSHNLIIILLFKVIIVILRGKGLCLSTVTWDLKQPKLRKKGLTMLSENIAHVLSQPLLKKIGDLPDLKMELSYHIISYELWRYALIIGLVYIYIEAFFQWNRYLQ